MNTREPKRPAMSERDLYDAIDAARRLVYSGNPWRNAVRYVAETYGVDPVSVAYYLGQYVAGTREASCLVGIVGRPQKIHPSQNPRDAYHG